MPVLDPLTVEMQGKGAGLEENLKNPIEFDTPDVACYKK